MVEPVHRSTDEARAGTTPHITRYVLGIGLALVVIVLGLVFLWGVGTRPDPAANSTRPLATEDRSGSLDTPASMTTPGTARAPTNSSASEPLAPQTGQAQSQDGGPP